MCRKGGGTNREILTIITAQSIIRNSEIIHYKDPVLINKKVNVMSSCIKSNGWLAKNCTSKTHSREVRWKNSSCYAEVISVECAENPCMFIKIQKKGYKLLKSKDKLLLYADLLLFVHPESTTHQLQWIPSGEF